MTSTPSGMLAGKTVLITGAAGGIGRASALLFSREGARVALADLDHGRTEEVKGEIERADGSDALALSVDLSDPASINAMFQDVFDAFGRLHCAFNNAGITGSQVGQGGRRTAEWEEEAYDRIMAVNAKGTWLCLRQELAHMQENGGGSIVSTASLAGLSGFVTQTGYAASKHAVIGMTRTAALEYAPTVRVNALCPGYVDTPMLKDSMARRGDMILGQIPFKRLATPLEMAEMVCWLLSDRSSYATGSAYEVDGGFMAG